MVEDYDDNDDDDVDDDDNDNDDDDDDEGYDEDDAIGLKIPLHSLNQSQTWIVCLLFPPLCVD